MKTKILLTLITVSISVLIVISIFATSTPRRGSASCETEEIVSRTVALSVSVTDSPSYKWGFVINGTVNPKISLKLCDRVTVHFTNNGQVVHDFSLDDFGMTKTESQLDPGKSIVLAFTADKTGEHFYHCEQPGHHDFGMQGIIVVR